MLIRLRTFVEVYRQRSISGAARGLGLTQPAVSQHIAGLEGTIGRPLFERSTHGVSPTPAADELAAEIGDRLDVAEAALAAAAARSTSVTGPLRIIGNADFLSEVVAPLLTPLLKAGVRVRLQTADREHFQQSLAEGIADLGVSGFPVDDKRLRSELVRNEPVIAVAAPQVVARIKAAVAGGQMPDLATALAAEPVLAYSIDRPLVDSWLAKNKLLREPVNPALTATDLRGLRRLLCVGYGWTAMPAYLCATEIARGELAEIPAPVAPDSNSYFLVWSPGALRQPRIARARQTLIRSLRDARLPPDDGDQKP